MGAFDEWHKGGSWMTTKYRGKFCQQSPCDLWSIQEIIHETKPQCIVYTGIADGGSLLFVSDAMRMVNHDGNCIAIGIDKVIPDQPVNGTLMLKGDSVSDEVYMQILDWTKPYERVMLILDSDHKKGHVRHELELYAPLVTIGQYLIVEDTCIGHTACMDFGPGPNEALQDWLPGHPEFKVDNTRTRWGLTQHPGGYLKKIGHV